MTSENDFTRLTPWVNPSLVGFAILALGLGASIAGIYAQDAVPAGMWPHPAILTTARALPIGILASFPVLLLLLFRRNSPFRSRRRWAISLLPIGLQAAALFGALYALAMLEIDTLGLFPDRVFSVSLSPDWKRVIVVVQQGGLGCSRSVYEGDLFDPLLGYTRSYCACGEDSQCHTWDPCLLGCAR